MNEPAACREPSISCEPGTSREPDASREPGASGEPGQDNARSSARVREMFSRIAGTYDLLNRLLSAGQDVTWRRRVGQHIDSGARSILDLCSGTGDLALELASRHPQARVFAGDFSFEMLRQGQDKDLQRRTALAAAVDAHCLPFADDSFDAVTVAFGVRNFEFLERGLREIHRVLRPGGQLAVLEFFRADSSWRNRPFDLYFRHVLPLVGAAVSRDREAYAYLPQSVGRFKTRGEFAELLSAMGFRDIEKVEMTLKIATLFLARTKNAMETGS